MENTRVVIYMVTYKDDFNKKHITFVRNYSEVKFLEDRFGVVYFERLDRDNEFAFWYIRYSNGDWF